MIGSEMPILLISFTSVTQNAPMLLMSAIGVICDLGDSLCHI